MYQGLSSGGLATIVTLLFRSVSTKSGYSTAYVLKERPSFRIPLILFPRMVTSLISPRSTLEIKSLNLMSSSGDCPGMLKRLNSKIMKRPTTTQKIKFLAREFIPSPHKMCLDSNISATPETIHTSAIFQGCGELEKPGFPRFLPLFRPDRARRDMEG